MSLAARFPLHPTSNNQHAQKKTISQPKTTSRKKKNKIEEKQGNTIAWDNLRKTYSKGRTRETTGKTNDSVDWEKVRGSLVEEVSKTIMGRGMHNVLAARIKKFLDRMVKDHGKIDLEWLRDVPPEKAKEFLLSIRGLGLKSVECVDRNVGRVAVRLGWVPLQPLPEGVSIHMLDQYPSVNDIQKYLWPRLCTLDQQTLYELHYQMITFGKVFCTKRRPNCNACPMRGDCRHFASACASARPALPVPQGESVVTSMLPVAVIQNPAMPTASTPLPLAGANSSESRYRLQNCEPIIEVPSSPGPLHRESAERDIEDLYRPSVDFMDNILQEGEVSKALVVLSAEAASNPVSKLKHVSRLRAVHQVYELPDSHPLVARLDKRDPDDRCPYLLAIWMNAEAVEAPQQPNIQEQDFQTVGGTILIPCRTANRGSFPLNGTYFQVNEVFADDDSSRHPIDVPREWIWNLRRRTLYCGTSTETIFRGLSTEEIQDCFWRGFVCVRGFNRKTGAPRPLGKRFHLSTTAARKPKPTDDELR
ncbi:unnamed protein product [Ilex paraguariensis]|uniref:Demeter RRM-fold domain-containing protein n=1 Tax=Ilex paraguariensis TaxID=185542 RepID=A0ABC8R1R4_9AQUA